MATEKKIENEIKKYLKSIGAYIVKHHGSRYSRVGVPDLLICYLGRFYGIEVKAPDEEPTDLQLYNIKQIKKAGGVAFIADNLPIVKQVFEKAKLEHARSDTKTH